MFELKYKIEESDFKSINKRIMLFYYILYCSVAAVGIIVGSIAIVLADQTFMRVLGIILVVLGGILCICAFGLLIAPKNFVVSVIPPSDDELNVKIDESGINIEAPNGSVIIPFAEVTAVRDKKQYLMAYVGKDVALMVKNAIITGQPLSELYKFLDARRNGVTNPVLAASADSAEEMRFEQASSEDQSERKLPDGTTDGDAKKD